MLRSDLGLGQAGGEGPRRGGEALVLSPYACIRMPFSWHLKMAGDHLRVLSTSSARGLMIEEGSTSQRAARRARLSQFSPGRLDVAWPFALREGLKSSQTCSGDWLGGV